MTKVVSLIRKDKSLTPFVFYSDFLKEVAKIYQDSNNNGLELKIIEGDEWDFTQKKYYIDPITLPLILSLAQQLKNYHEKPVKLHLSNTPITVQVLEFLFYSDFFNIVGKNSNPDLPLGKNILEFDSNFLGGFRGSTIRTEHKLRHYSLFDENLHLKLNSIEGETSKRDYLVEHYTYKVKDHFYELLFEKENTQYLSTQFVEILAELITNGVLHSESDVFALMFSDRYKTKFSISDNGIGLYESLNRKEPKDNSYRKFELLNSLGENFPLNVPTKIKTSILSLFETLYYSMLKERQGLFDLMLDVVLSCGGYFRLHTDNAQIIVSARMLNELKSLSLIRDKILTAYNQRLFDLIGQEDLIKAINRLSIESREKITRLANSILQKYTEDTRFSAIRIFEVKFRGVHIEVEIPNSIEKE